MNFKKITAIVSAFILIFNLVSCTFCSAEEVVGGELTNIPISQDVDAKGGKVSALDILFYVWLSIAVPGFLFGGVPEIVNGINRLIN